MNDMAQTSSVARSTSVGRPAARGRGGWLLGTAVLLAMAGALAFGTFRYVAQQDQVMRTAQLQRDFVPGVRVAITKASDPIIRISLPATTLAFAQADISARATGYIGVRNVDIGSRVKSGDVLAEIVAPELDDQIAQAEATLGQDQAQLKQIEATRDLAQVTNARNSTLVKQGWVTQQQGDTDRLTLEAQQAGVGVAQANIAAQQAQLRVLRQQKAYQRVIAPFPGVITQRNVDLGDLVQADAGSGTFMFTLMQSDPIRTQVYVPQDAAFGLTPGVDAVIRVPEIPDRTFPGKVTRIADALQPGTRTLLAEIDVPNHDGALTAGTYCTVELQIPRRTPSFVVPGDAIIFNSKGLQVAVVEGGVVHMRPVTVARDFGTEMEISDGLKAGDQVVRNAPVSLLDSARVSIRPDEAKQAG
jgi:RND family efflux transporter MFP subunit